MIELNQLEQLIYIAENKTRIINFTTSPFTLYAKIRK